ncbi:MAG: hypothetical protein ACOC3V_04440 [bacterium]
MIVLIKMDDNCIPLIDCKISYYNHNIYIISKNINDIFNVLFKCKHDNILNKEIQILTNNKLFLIKNGILQDVKLLKNEIHLNIIGETIIKYDDPTGYNRNIKIKKIINKICGKSI